MFRHKAGTLHEGARDYEPHCLAQPFSAVLLHFSNRNGRLAIAKLSKQVARNTNSLVRGSAKSGALRIAKDLGPESGTVSLAALTHVMRGQSEIQSVFQLHRRAAPPRG
jgi:hypothetical protein